MNPRTWTESRQSDVESLQSTQLSIARQMQVAQDFINSEKETNADLEYEMFPRSYFQTWEAVDL
jgi:hypothetical protein